MYVARERLRHTMMRGLENRLDTTPLDCMDAQLPLFLLKSIAVFMYINTLKIIGLK